jgi:hypothetical protein
MMEKKLSILLALKRDRTRSNNHACDRDRDNKLDRPPVKTLSKDINLS